jgi:hypothetical protein
MSGCTCSNATCPTTKAIPVLNLAYNALLGGQRLEDTALRRNDEAFLDGLGARAHPRPDHQRRFYPPL